MNRDQLLTLIDSLVSGDISPADHQTLQNTLKSDAIARICFRERMDLEAGLRTWAAEVPVQRTDGFPISDLVENVSSRGNFSRSHLVYIAIGITAALLLLAVTTNWIGKFDASPLPEVAENEPQRNPLAEQRIRSVGIVRQQRDCKWVTPPALAGGRFEPGQYTLARGVAEFSFESGTDVILEGPCELVVLARDSARLVQGNVFVNVTELSHGFTLETPEARVIDEGTEYAVAIDDTSTEVHVFDGSVIWQPHVDHSKPEDRIEAGEAKRFLRERPSTALRIPFGQRQFVRRLAAELKGQAGAELLAYDGFENLAGQLRRDRSGFGWSGGWLPGGRGRGKLSEVVDAPSDVAFGVSRSGHRLLCLSKGDDLRRQFEKSLAMQPGATYFISFLMTQLANESETETALQISLEPNATDRKHRQQQVVSFGVTSRKFPYINSHDTISETASPISDGEVCFCVVKLAVVEQGLLPSLRVYRTGEQIDDSEPLAWTVSGAKGTTKLSAESIRLSAGQNARWYVDELKVGTTWRSVTLVDAF